MTHVRPAGQQAEDHGGGEAVAELEERVQTLFDDVTAFFAEQEVDCLVTNNACIDLAEPTRHAVVEFGFPSFGRHALYDRPFLGFGGFLAFAETLADHTRTFLSFKDKLRPAD